MGLFLGFLFCSIDLFLCQYHTILITIALQNNLEVQNCDASSFAFLFQDCFGYSGSFVCWIVCCSSVKNAGGILIGIALNV